MTKQESPSTRRLIGRLSITAGNSVQLVGIGAAGVALTLAQSSTSKVIAVGAMLSAWTLLYFFCHGIAHWFVGRLVGIRFSFYTIGGTGNPQAYPPGLRWIFEHLPFFGVQTDKASMQSASPRVKAAMWSAGVTSSAVVPTLGAVCAWRARVPASKPFLIFAAVWALATLASNWTSRTGDFSKARRALGGI